MMSFSRSLACLTALAGLLPLSTAKAEVVLTKSADAVAVSIDGQEFTIFHFAASQPKPYFSPVRAADGAIVTRAIGDDVDKDHPHHKGIWFATDEINGHKHWAEKQKIVNQSVTLTKPKGNPARLTYVNHWLDDAGEPLMTETTHVDIYDNRLMAFDFSMKMIKAPLEIEDTKEGLFGVRVATSMREKAGLGGVITDSEGRTTMKDCWGKTGPWVDYSGPVGDKTYGVAIFDHPENFRPSRYHCRDYGLFSVSPFGEGSYQNDKSKAAIVHLNSEHPELRLRYALYVHDGNVKTGHVADTYQRYAAGQEK